MLGRKVLYLPGFFTYGERSSRPASTRSCPKMGLGAARWTELTSSSTPPSLAASLGSSQGRTEIENKVVRFTYLLLATRRQWPRRWCHISFPSHVALGLHHSEGDGGGLGGVGLLVEGFAGVRDSKAPVFATKQPCNNFSLCPGHLCCRWGPKGTEIPRKGKVICLEGLTPPIFLLLWVEQHREVAEYSVL